MISSLSFLKISPKPLYTALYTFLALISPVTVKSPVAFTNLEFKLNIPTVVPLAFVPTKCSIELS